MMRQYLTIILTLFICLIYGQDSQVSSLNEPLAINKTMEVGSDSLSNSAVPAQKQLIDTVRIDTTLIEGKTIALIDHIEVSEFDQKWLESWKNNVIDSSLVIKPEDTIGKLVIQDFTTEQLKERIAYLDSQTPFNFEYNPSLEKIIKHYLKNRQQTLANLMGKAKYYFQRWVAG